MILLKLHEREKKVPHIFFLLIFVIIKDLVNIKRIECGPNNVIVLLNDTEKKNMKIDFMTIFLRYSEQIAFKM